MLRKLRVELPSHSTIAAYAALFVALGGVSYAAVSIPGNSIGKSQLKANSVTSAKVKNRSLKAIDLAKGVVRRGARGPIGPQGPQGERGPAGTNGTNGTNGVMGDILIKRVDAPLADNTTGAAQAICPDGTKLIGGGSSVGQTGSDDIKLMVSRPGSGALVPTDGSTTTTDGANTWRVVYRNPAGGTGAATIRAFAFCAQSAA